MPLTSEEMETRIASGDLLLHGLSVDALVSVLRDGCVDHRFKADDFDAGISLTRSLQIATEHALSQEQHFDTVLESYYEMRDETCQNRFGAVMVFDRERLSDLQLVHVDYLGDGLFDEQEERVVGTIADVRSRLVAIVCVSAELDWYQHVAIPGMDEGDMLASELGDALQFVRRMAVPAAAAPVPQWHMRPDR